MTNRNNNILPATALVGITFMMCNTSALAISDIANKILRNDLSSGMIVFLYKFGLLLLTLPWILFHGTKHIKTKRFHFHLLRSFFGTFGAISFAQGLKYVTMADAAAFENIQYILIVLLSIIFFNDALDSTKIIAVLVGFLGISIIVNPGLIRNVICGCDNGISVASDYSKYSYTFLAICCWSINSLLVKALGNTEHNRTQMFYLLLFSSIWSFPAAFIKWNVIEISGQSLPIMPEFYDPGLYKLTMQNIVLLSLMGICYFIHGIAYFNALKHDLSIVIPFRYTKLVFSGLLGYAIFGEEIDRYAIIGYLLVISSSFMLIRYELKKRKKAKAQV
jgi:drug/metabolite transporter (DMT)-like permease